MNAKTPLVFRPVWISEFGRMGVGQTGWGITVIRNTGDGWRTRGSCLDRKAGRTLAGHIIEGLGGELIHPVEYLTLAAVIIALDEQLRALEAAA